MPPLRQVRWWRLICDESHSISHAGTEKSNALMGLVADHKWLVSGTKTCALLCFGLLVKFCSLQCLSPGTPIQTSLTDLKNQLKFLGIDNINEMFLMFRNTLEHTNDRAAQQGKKWRRGRHFSNYMREPELGNLGKLRFGHFMFFLRSVFLRHSQQQRYRSSVPKVTLMSLPPKVSKSRDTLNSIDY